MRTAVFALVLSLFMFTGFSHKVNHFDFFGTAIAQEVAQPEASVEAAPAVEVVEKDVKVVTASDIQDSKLEIPVWLGAVVEFIKATPVVGPYVVKALAFCGIIAAILTLLSTLLMGLSGIINLISGGKASPGWMGQVKKWLDYAISVMKYLSIYNVQKDQSK